METDPSMNEVFSAYGTVVQSGRVESLGSAGGFSGARFWRVTTSRGVFCLRKWPREHPDKVRLEFIHAVLRHVQACGFDKVPVPLTCRGGRTFVAHAGHLWELTPWLPGTADFHQFPSAAKLNAAVRALAEFHRSAATLSGHRPHLGASDGLRARREQIRRLMADECRRIAKALDDADWPELADRARRLLQIVPRLAPHVQSLLDRAMELRVPLQPCICDIWHDHVLYVGETVSGIIDFGAMRTESVAGDIARLLGSLAVDHQPKWQHGLESYDAIRPLSAEERTLITAFDRSNVLLSGVNWLRWILIEKRQFNERQKIFDRLEENVQRLEDQYRHGA